MLDNCGVYLIISPTNKRYVVSSKNIKKRFNRYKNLSCHNQHALLASLKKYGYDKHKIIVLYNCHPNELLFWERVFGDLYLALADLPNGLNIRLPAYDDVGASICAEARIRIKEGCKKRFSKPEEIKKISEKAKKALSDPELRKRISNSHKIRWTEELRQQKSDDRKEYFKNNPEQKKILSDATKSYYERNPDKKAGQQVGLNAYYEANPTIRRDRMNKKYANNPELGKEHSNKLKEYYKKNPEKRELASKRTKAQLADPENNIRSKQVMNKETGEIYSCARVVADMIGTPYNTFRNWLNNKSPNPTVYIWMK